MVKEKLFNHNNGGDTEQSLYYKPYISFEINIDNVNMLFSNYTEAAQQKTILFLRNVSSIT